MKRPIDPFSVRPPRFFGMRKGSWAAFLEPGIAGLRSLSAGAGARRARRGLPSRRIEQRRGRRRRGDRGRCERPHRRERRRGGPERCPVGQRAPAGGPASDKPLLGITAFVATVYKEPRDTAKKLGYLRVGTHVARSAEPVGKSGCAGGWYAIQPHGFVCAGEDATTDMDHPVLKAAAHGPNLKTALPFHYAFVRAVLPLYIRVPTSKEQFSSEMALQKHLDWFKDNRDEVSRVTLGANDVPIDDRGVPLPDKKLGEMGLGKNSQEVGIGVLLGGESEADPVPFWLEGGKRSIPNISDYKTKGFEIFADRARRHTGLSLIGSFSPGPESLDRRLAITADLRLAPASKLKPDSGSPWHGLELTDALTLPLAFVRSQGARSYKITHGKVAPATRSITAPSSA